MSLMAFFPTSLLATIVEWELICRAFHRIEAWLLLLEQHTSPKSITSRYLIATMLLQCMHQLLAIWHHFSHTIIQRSEDPDKWGRILLLISTWRSPYFPCLSEWYLQTPRIFRDQSKEAYMHDLDPASIEDTTLWHVNGRTDWAHWSSINGLRYLLYSFQYSHCVAIVSKE